MAAENFKVKKGLEVGTAITATSSGVNVTGIVTATQFVGDGSGLTGVTGSGSGVVVKDEGSAVGTAGTINFVGSGVAATLSQGTATVTINSGGLSDVVADTTPQLGGNLDLNGKFINGTGGANITGVVTATTLKGNGDFVDIDVDGTAELDNVNIAGVTTMTGNLTLSSPFPKIIITDTNNDSDYEIANANGLFRFKDITNSTDRLTIASNGTVNVNNDLNVDGRADLDDVVVAGVSTFSSNIDANGNIDVSGRADLDDLVVSGVGTFSTRIDTNGVSFGTNNNTFAAKFVDNAVANFGTDNDLKISHNDSDATIVNNTGALRLQDDTYIVLEKLNGDNMLRCDGGGAVNLYFNGGSPKLVTASHGVVITGVATATTFSGSGASLTNLPSAQLTGALPALDGSALTGVTASGTGIIVRHDGNVVGTASSINFSTNLDVSAISAGIVTVTASGGGGGGLSNIVEDTSPQLGGTLDTNQNNIHFNDNVSVRFGSSQDFDIYHSGTNGIIDNNTGDLYIQTTGSGDDILIESADDFTVKVAGSETAIQATGDGAVELYHNNVKTLFTTANGIQVQGPSGGIGQIVLSADANEDNADKFKLVVEDNGPLKIQNRASGSWETNIECNGNGNVELYHNNARKLETTQTGVVITGIATATTFSGSGASLTALNASNLGSGTIPNGRFPATLPATSGANLTALNASEITSGTLPIARIADDAVTFAKMQNVGTGVIIGRNDAGSGDIETLSAAEVRTLINVENGATADQTAAEIRTLVESASDSNVFTDADHSKLDGIATGANVGITTSPDNVVGTWSVTANGSSAYRFTGPGQSGNEDNPDIYLVRGQRYSFINTTGSSHPFRFRVSSGGSTYSDGVSGSENGTQYFNVQHDAPASLVYQCTIHGGMVGNIYIVGQHLANGADNRIVTATSAYGLNAESTFTYTGSALTMAGDIVFTNTSTEIKTNSSDGSDNKRIILAGGGDNSQVRGAQMTLYGNEYSSHEGRLQLLAGNSGNDNGVIQMNTGGSERVRILSGGNVNIGGNYTQTTFKAQIQTGTNKFISFGDAAHNDLSNEGSGIIFSRQSDGSKSLSGIFGHSNTSLGIAARDSLTFHAGGTSTYSAAPERLRINSSGNLLIGRTSASSFDNQLQLKSITVETDGDTTGMQFNRTDTNAAWVAMRFYTQGGQRGYIQINTNSVTYNTGSSDIRVKKDIEDWNEEVLPYFKSLKPQKFRFNSEDQTAEKTKGYMAQDNLDKFPEAYPLNSQDDRYWFAPQHMVPYLMKALQEEIVKREEIEAKYNALEARISALEGS